MKRSIKIISILLAITLMVTLFPANIYAAKKSKTRTVNIYVCDNCNIYMDKNGIAYDYEYWKENHKRKNGKFFNKAGLDCYGHSWREYYYGVNLVLKEERYAPEYEARNFYCPYKLDFTEKKDICIDCKNQCKYNKWNTFYQTENQKNKYINQWYVSNRLVKRYQDVLPGFEFPKTKLVGQVSFYDQKLDGTALSDRKVKVSWTKCKDADGYEVLVSTKVTAMNEYLEIKSPNESDADNLGVENRLSVCTHAGAYFDNSNTERKVIAKNSNSTTITLPNPVNNIFTAYYGKNEVYKYENSDAWTENYNDNWIQYKYSYSDSLEGAFFIRYRAYKIVNKKKVWSDWSQIKLVVPEEKNLKQMYEDLWIDNRGTVRDLGYEGNPKLDAFTEFLEEDYFLNDNVRRLEKSGIIIE